MPDTQLDSSEFKFGREIAFGVGEAVGEFEAIVGLDALYPDALASVPFQRKSADE